MDDLDFSGKFGRSVHAPPADTIRHGEQASIYDPKLALGFFRLAGTQEQFPAGRQIFAEEEKSGGFFSKGARVYLLLEGEVALTLKGKPLELVLPGEIFGEMATIADIPRNATATARKNCRVLTLDEKQFLHSLQQMPEFALMLMSIMAQRLRRSVAKLAKANKTSVAALEHKNTLDKRMLADLQRELGDLLPTIARADQTVVTQGAVGACMFVVTQGRVAISIDGLVIEHVGPGGVFGEMALVDRSGRSATATAEAGSAWLMIARQDFLSMIKSKPAFGIALLRSMSARVQHIGNLLRDGSP
ncbi:MAG: cyclic nucleotide-binding domain-containing protein [Sulfuritalea sp.]|nr:cyclic nucleotide-binding domain-containing protein [Sulfuritalea sp.]